MVKNFLSLHLSDIATEFDQRMLKTLYMELVQNAPTLFSGGLPEHTIAVVATRTKEDEYDIVIVNSGLGIENHERTIAIQPKGFHTGASYDNDSSDEEPVEATSYNPLLRMKGITGAHLSLAHYHSGTMDEVYYVVKNASIHVVKEPLMPWEWTEAQGIGTCSATSVWFALRFYYQALAYESDLRLSMLDQAIDDLKELQNKAERLEHQLNADYQEAWEAFKKAHKDSKTQRFEYKQSYVKEHIKIRTEKSLHLRRTTISMALNEILRNLIVWYHELGDITANLTIEKSKDKESTKTAQHSKMTQRREVLEKAVSQAMASFHSFWKLQEKKYAERQKTASGKEAASLSVLDSWHSIREDVRTMYNDAIGVLKSKPAFKTVLAKEAVVTRKFKPIDVKSLDEHSSLAQILGYIINFGDSPALRQAIREHIQKHTKNANAAKYLLVLYACLTKNVPLLDHLVVQQKLPLRYAIDKTKRLTGVSMYLDLKTEESIAALAAHGLAKYGQPLNSFPQLFAMSKKKTWRIVRKFKTSYKKIAPIVNVESPSQARIDEAFKAFVKQGKIAAIAYILPKASRKAIGDAFVKAGNVRVLRLLIDLFKDSYLLEEKIETSSKNNNAKIVKFLLPCYLRYKKRKVEADMIKKRMLGSDITGKLAEVSLPDRLLDIAYEGNAVGVMQLLAPLSNENVTKRLFLKAAKDGKSEMAHALARHVADDAITTAIEEAEITDQGDLASALFEVYVHKNPIEALFLAAQDGNSEVALVLASQATEDAIFTAAEKANTGGHADLAKALIEEYVHKNPSGGLFLKAAEEENLGELER